MPLTASEKQKAYRDRERKAEVTKMIEELPLTPDQCTSEEQYVLWHRIAALEVARVKKSSPQQTGERAIRAEDYARWRWAQFESGEAAL
jgi:hypothetical protein